jgi:RNA recognition motif-containing protein
VQDEGSESEIESSEGKSDEEEEEENSGKPKGKKGVNEAETGRLFVRNLPFTITEEELQGLFGEYGSLSEVSLISYLLSPSSLPLFLSLPLPFLSSSPLSSFLHLTHTHTHHRCTFPMTKRRTEAKE